MNDILLHAIEFKSHHFCEGFQLGAPVAVGDGVVLGDANFQYLLEELLYRNFRFEDGVGVCCKKVLLAALGGLLLREAVGHEGDQLVTAVLLEEAGHGLLAGADAERAEIEI